VVGFQCFQSFFTAQYTVAVGLTLPAQLFVVENVAEDFLLNGFQGRNANPYRRVSTLYIVIIATTINTIVLVCREKSSCSVL
jgi:hypothetical protein